MTSLDLSTHPRRRRTASATERALLAASALLSIAALWGCVESWRELQRVQADVSTARREAEAAQLRARALEGGGDAGSEAVVSKILWTTDAPPARVLADLTALLPGEARLTDLTLAYGPKLELDLRLTARRAEAYDAFLKSLGDSPRFQDVVPGPENRDGDVQASLQLSYRRARP